MLLPLLCKAQTSTVADTALQPECYAAAAAAAAILPAFAENASVCGAVTRDDVAAVVIQALLSNKADGKVREVEQKCDVMCDVWLCTCVTLGLGGMVPG